MHTLQSTFTIKDILSTAPYNPALWNLFIAELAGIMQCNSGFLAIADLSRRGGFHHLYRYNIHPEQQSCFERNLCKAGSFEASVAKQPHQVLCSTMLNASHRHDSSPEPDVPEKLYRFGVSFPLNSRYAYCLVLNGSHTDAEPELQASMQRLQALVPSLQIALQ